MTAHLHEGDCRTVLPTLAADSFNSVVTDPPYEIGFMGRGWDRTGIAFDVEMWRAALRVLKPGGYMLAFGGTRTYHRLTCAVENAGFEVRDCLMWLYGTGFPKGDGCLKPAWEPILLTRKPGPRVLPLQVDACRVPCDTPVQKAAGSVGGYRGSTGGNYQLGEGRSYRSDGRYPANVVHDGSDEVMEAFAAFGAKVSAPRGPHRGAMGYRGGDAYHDPDGVRGYADTGTAARFFYCAKAPKSERTAAADGSSHPAQKPLALMRWLVRLITPPGGHVLDPFAGSGTTLLAAEREGLSATGIEQDAGHCEIIRRRLDAAKGAARLHG